MQPDPPKRKRGGQPGNRNARKYGLYSPRCAPLPPPPLAANMDAEVLVLKTFIRRAVAAASPADTTAEIAAGLRAINRAVHLLCCLRAAHWPSASPSPAVRRVELDILADLEKIIPFEHPK